MASPNVLTITDANFDTEVLHSTLPVLLDFWAPWCGPCRQIAPIIDEIADERVGKARIGKVNVDECPGLAAKFRVSSIPILLFIKEGTVKDQVVGAGTGKSSLLAKIDALS